MSNGAQNGNTDINFGSLSIQNENEDIPKVYVNDISPPVRFVLMTIKYLDIKVKYIEVDLTSEERFSMDYLKLNPMHTVPTLVHNDLVLTDSHAICMYLVNEFAPNSTLYPQNFKLRAKIDCFLHFNSGIFFPRESAILRSVFEAKLKDNYPEKLNQFEESLGFMEEYCKKSKWLVSDDHMTLADLCCISTFSTFKLLVPLPKERFPHVEKWAGLCEEHEVYKTVNKLGLDHLRLFIIKHGKFDHISEKYKANINEMLMSNAT